jgi:hypothetical protein
MGAVNGLQRVAGGVAEVLREDRDRGGGFVGVDTGELHCGAHAGDLLFRAAGDTLQTVHGAHEGLELLGRV